MLEAPIVALPALESWRESEAVRSDPTSDFVAEGDVTPELDSEPGADTAPETVQQTTDAADVTGETDVAGKSADVPPDHVTASSDVDRDQPMTAALSFAPALPAIDEEVWDGVSSFTIQAPDDVSPITRRGDEAGSPEMPSVGDADEAVDDYDSRDAWSARRPDADRDERVEAGPEAGQDPPRAPAPTAGASPAHELLAAGALAAALEDVAGRIRRGELRAPRFDPRAGDAAALAAALAGLLGVEG